MFVLKYFYFIFNKVFFCYWNCLLQVYFRSILEYLWILFILVFSVFRYFWSLLHTFISLLNFPFGNGDISTLLLLFEYILISLSLSSCLSLSQFLAPITAQHIFPNFQLEFSIKSVSCFLGSSLQRISHSRIEEFSCSIYFVWAS